MNELLDRWRKSPLWDNLLKKKKVVQEPQYSSDLDEVMFDYRNALKETKNGPDHDGVNGALLLAVFRGKMSEGIDFSDDEARCVITVCKFFLFNT